VRPALKDFRRPAALWLASFQDKDLEQVMMSSFGLEESGFLLIIYIYNLPRNNGDFP
jgi:hypothetical protein